ncbi:MAG TPA: hypothetical protein VMW66_03865 [Elusimicrobiales bacterium]|nr:hypothetical protein [Elusimicrobiales bacterium]
MKNQGYIKIYRKILDNFIYLDSQAVHLWLHILLKANHAKKEFLFNGKKQILKSGQFILSRDKVSLETNINPSKVYRLLKILEREQLIEQQTNNHFTKITVLNYSKYQNNITTIEHQNEQPVNNQRTTSEQPVNTNNNDKNDKNDKNDNNKIDNDFEKFWSEYPKKVGKPKALVSFKRQKPDMVKLLFALSKQKHSRQWQDYQFIPHPTTYLNQRRWEDSLTEYTNMPISPKNDYMAKETDKIISDMEKAKREKPLTKDEMEKLKKKAGLR